MARLETSGLRRVALAFGLLLVACGATPEPSVSPPVTTTSPQAHTGTPIARLPETAEPTPALTASPTPAVTAEPTPRFTPTRVLSRGRWILAPDERPVPASTSLRAIVYEQGCPSRAFQDEIYEPLISYRSEFPKSPFISIVFPILSAPSTTDCHGAQGTPVTVELSQPIRNWTLVDGGGGTRLRHAHGISIYWSDGEGAAALERARTLIDASWCESTVHGDREAFTPSQLLEMSNDIAATEGPVEGGNAFIGDWEDAAQFFGAVEAYDDGDVYHAILASAMSLGLSDRDPAALVLMRLQSWTLVGARQIWYPAYLFRDFLGATVFEPCVASV
jgi:hypothetical protein